MVFSSIVFLFFFFPLVLFFYFTLPSIKVKNFILLFFSLLFYSWGEGEVVFLIILLTFLNYLICFAIDRWRDSKTPIIIGVAMNVLMLVYFKYIGLLVGSFDSLFGTHFNNGIDIPLPIGISFFTFHAISYIVDVHRKKAALQKDPIKLLLYFALFPQLIAGPIVRYSLIEHELYKRQHSLEKFVAGAKRFCLGLGKKVLIANVLGELSDTLIDLPGNESYFATAWIGILAYSLFIYFDFSGYSDMAIGLARMFGFTFPENFNFPYFAKSIKDFWRRWHMSLSTWFRDYVYIPLGGNQKGLVRTYINLIAVFFLTGLWHGATWNFVIWGLFHGMFMLIERGGFERVLDKTPVFNRLYTLFVVVFAWIFFRITDLSDALDFIVSLFRSLPTNSTLRLEDWITNEYITMFVLGVIFAIPWRPVILQFKERFVLGWKLEMWQYLTTLFYFTLLVLSSMSIASSTYNPFIYFRF
jgi:alginate O-acetyltransferase complex protein AlgI